jgi:hypothetical protein
VEVRLKCVLICTLQVRDSISTHTRKTFWICWNSVANASKYILIIALHSNSKRVSIQIRFRTRLRTCLPFSAIYYMRVQNLCFLILSLIVKYSPGVKKGASIKWNQSASIWFDWYWCWSFILAAGEYVLITLLFCLILVNIAACIKMSFSTLSVPAFLEAKSKQRTDNDSKKKEI